MDALGFPPQENTSSFGSTLLLRRGHLGLARVGVADCGAELFAIGLVVRLVHVLLGLVRDHACRRDRPGRVFILLRCELEQIACWLVRNGEGRVMESTARAGRRPASWHDAPGASGAALRTGLKYAVIDISLGYLPVARQNWICAAAECGGGISQRSKCSSRRRRRACRRLVLARTA